MLISEKYPSGSKYLRAEDLQGQEVRVRVDRLDEDVMMGVPREAKDVLYFIGKRKGLVLNPTNARTLAQGLGDSSNGWGGATIVLYEEETDMGPGIRIRVIKRAEQGNSKKLHTEANPPPHTDAELETVPF